MLVAWGALVALGRWWGLRLLAHGRRLELPQPPLLGRSGPGLTPRLAVPVVVALVLVVALPWASRRLRWSWLPVASAVGSAAWAVGLAFVDGPTWTDGLTRGLTGGNELGADVNRVAAHPGRFLATFSRDIAQYHVQVRGHPPGMILVLVALRHAGLSGPGWAAALCIVAGCAAAAVVLVAARLVAGEEQARRAAPFVVLSPAAIWIATSTDAFFLLVAAVTVTLALAALQSRRPGRTRRPGRPRRPGRTDWRWRPASGSSPACCSPTGWCWWRWCRPWWRGDGAGPGRCW